MSGALGRVVDKDAVDNGDVMVPQMEDLGATRELRVMRAEKRAFSISHRSYPGEAWQIVAQTDASYGCKIITLRSVVQVPIQFRLVVFLHCRLRYRAAATIHSE